MRRPRALFDQRMAMRDGVLLSADVYLPPVGDAFPVLLCRTLYSKGVESRDGWGSTGWVCGMGGCGSWRRGMDS